MCFTAVAVGLLAADTLVSSQAAYDQSKAMQAQAQLEQRIALQNQQIAMQDKKRIAQETNVAKQDALRRRLQAMGSARADAAARGVSLDFDDSSASLHLEDILIESDFDLAKISDEGAVRERQADIKGFGYSSTANLYGQKASSYNPSADRLGTLIGGSANTAVSWRVISGG